MQSYNVGWCPRAPQGAVRGNSARGVFFGRPRRLTPEQREKITEMVEFQFQKSTVFEKVTKHRETVAEGNLFERLVRDRIVR
jgi:hypothetical protein